MTVVSSTTDPDNLTLTVVAQFDADVERVWDVWADARKLERWWGPPMCPATFERHEFSVGGESRYFMSLPDGEKAHGWWRIEAIEPRFRIEFLNGLAGEDGEPDPEHLPMFGVVVFEPTQSGTRMTCVTTYRDTRQMQEMLERGMQDGMRLALGQIDGLLSPVSVSAA
jgi:uncharacterized protein YndB with AHSA1/START domain